MKRLAFLLIRGIVLLGVVSLAVVMLIIFFLYRPVLRQQTMEDAVATGSILASQIDVAVQRVVGYSDFYVDSPGLKDALRNYEKSPGEAAREEACQVLGEIQPAGIAEVYNALILQEGRVLAASQPLTEADSRMLNADWNFHIMDGTVSEEFSPFYTRNSGVTEEKGMLYLRNFTVGEERYTLGLICSTEQIEKDILRLSEGLFSGYAIATMSGPSFYDYGDTADSSAVLEKHADELTFRDRDASGYYIADTIPAGSWKVVAYLSNEQFDARFVPVLTAALLMCLLVCVVLILLVFLVAAICARGRFLSGCCGRLGYCVRPWSGRRKEIWMYASRYNSAVRSVNWGCISTTCWMRSSRPGTGNCAVSVRPGRCTMTFWFPRSTHITSTIL